MKNVHTMDSGDFFKYLIENFDKMKEYGTEPVNLKLSIPSPAYNVLAGNYTKYSKLFMQKKTGFLLRNACSFFILISHFSFLTSCLLPLTPVNTHVHHCLRLQYQSVSFSWQSRQLRIKLKNPFNIIINVTYLNGLR